MLIINDDHLKRADVCSLDELCPFCRKPLREYPLVMSDDAAQAVYHVACAFELATNLLVDLSTFFSPPAPYASLFTLTAPPSAEGGSDAISRS